MTLKGCAVDPLLILLQLNYFRTSLETLYGIKYFYRLIWCIEGHGQIGKKIIYKSPWSHFNL